jgi:hypothetical protein
MFGQLVAWLGTQSRRLARALGILAVFAVRAAGAIWSVARVPLIGALQVLAAIIVIFEEWGWRPLSNLLGQLARFRVWARAELWVAGLPPYGALVALALPSAILFPTKLIGVYLLAIGQVATAIVLLIAAKLASTALIARVFTLTKPALMQIEWFSRAYDAFVPWQEAMFAWLRSSAIWRYGRVIKRRVKNFTRRSWAQWRPRLLAAWAIARPRAATLWLQIQHNARKAGVRTYKASKVLLQRLRKRDF